MDTFQLTKTDAVDEIFEVSIWTFFILIEGLTLGRSLNRIFTPVNKLRPFLRITLACTA